MDNFLGTLVFLLPGVLAYFWLQAFGINPVVKHTPGEFTAVAALLWLPVSFGTLLLYNWAVVNVHYFSGVKPIWIIKDLLNASGSLVFLTAFFMLSLVVSFFISAIWAKWGYRILLVLINTIRKWRGVAAFSKGTSVWETVFLNNDDQYIEFGRLDIPEKAIVGRITKASRPFEPERNLFLDKTANVRKIIDEYEIPITNIFIDTKTGLYIKILDKNSVDGAMPFVEITGLSSSEAAVGVE
ncbi:hypothetical protein REC12_11535 [Desulfosporosinus sp. PR]|uniref:hypothetical protein n=1 Tax=Candidatus Desulfosporosinus nitrosoreducens TaxID=3401928 RepID=UPI0027F532D9|nr:hypothetical protein [Desulfosporosinus sp. PR]MDQ7094221.1 hypothetical protein [Desulfosporosinus sp. PR]